MPRRRDPRDYGVGLVGNAVALDLVCTGNDPGVTNFGAPNTVSGTASGQCAAV
jgi:hypothetical protein